MAENISVNKDMRYPKYPKKTHALRSKETLIVPVGKKGYRRN